MDKLKHPVFQLGMAAWLSCGVYLGIVNSEWILFGLVIIALIGLALFINSRPEKTGKDRKQEKPPGFIWRSGLVGIGVPVLVAIYCLILVRQEADATAYRTINTSLPIVNTEIRNVIKEAMADGELSSREYSDIMALIVKSQTIVRIEPSQDLEKERERLRLVLETR